MTEKMIKTGQFALNLAENTAVKATTLVAAIALIAGGTWNVSTWKHEMEANYAALKREVDQRTDDRWRARDQYYFCIQLEALNDGFTCPEIHFGDYGD